MIAISFSAPPGPVTMETIRRGLRGGFSPALNVQLGSIIGDFMWFMIALIGLGQLAQIAVIRGALAIIGVGLLLYLGYCGMRDAFKAAQLDQGGAIDTKKGAFRSGMAISIANPMAIGYWLSIGGTLVATGMAGQSGGQTAIVRLRLRGRHVPVGVHHGAGRALRQADPASESVPGDQLRLRRGVDDFRDHVGKSDVFVGASLALALGDRRCRPSISIRNHSKGAESCQQQSKPAPHLKTR